MNSRAISLVPVGRLEDIPRLQGRAVMVAGRPERAAAIPVTERDGWLYVGVDWR